MFHLQIVFKSRVIQINSDYRQDPELPKNVTYVLDIYQLARQLFPDDIVKTMQISEILKKVNIPIDKYLRAFFIHANPVSFQCRQVDAELIQRQVKLKQTIANYKKIVLKCKSVLAKQAETPAHP